MAKAIVLLAEDDFDTRRLVHHILADAGFSVIDAEDGEQALQALEHSLPDLLLTDLAMPGLDGLELIRRVRARTDLSHLPIVVMTACGPDYRTQAMMAGATSTVQKPADPDYLVETINQALSQRRDHQPETQQIQKSNGVSR